MDRRLAIWLCIYCNTTKSSTKPDWMVLSCDHLICLACLNRYKEFLLNVPMSAYAECGLIGVPMIYCVRRNRPRMM